MQMFFEGFVHDYYKNKFVALQTQKLIKSSG